VTHTDTGPLVALINRNDPNHVLCTTTAKQLPACPLVTTWPCFTEAMYLVFRAGGFPAQAALWRLRTTGRLLLHDLSVAEVDRMVELMEKYRDRPMDLADASLVVVAEHLRIRRLFTLDNDFHIYRLADGSALDLVP
jgi:predicted nucleic acid-binding protein